MSFLYLLESIRNPVLDFLFSIITLCGEEIAFMAVGMIFFWCIDKYKGYFLLCVGFLGTAINQVLKMIFRIPRPWIKDPDFTIVESAREAATGYSFPSGHTQTAVGLFGGIARFTKKKAILIESIAVAVLVPLSRMYLGVHTPADVLVSTCIATALIFIAYPLFNKAANSPKVMFSVLGALTLIMAAYACFIMLYPFPAEVYAEDVIHNLESAQETAFTLLGCMLGLTLAYAVDIKWIKFETDAVWWVQIIKAVGGLLLVVAVKALAKAPLEALLVNALAARCVRYFLMVVVGGILWPMTFKYFAKLGRKKA